MGIIFFEKNEPHAAWERSGGALGALLGGLGALKWHIHTHLHTRACTCAHGQNLTQKSMPKMTHFGSQKGPKWHPKRSKKRPKIDAKNGAKKEPN